MCAAPYVTGDQSHFLLTQVVTSLPPQFSQRGILCLLCALGSASKVSSRLQSLSKRYTAPLLCVKTLLRNHSLNSIASDILTCLMLSGLLRTTVDKCLQCRTPDDLTSATDCSMKRLLVYGAPLDRHCKLYLLYAVNRASLMSGNRSVHRTCALGF